MDGAGAGAPAPDLVPVPCPKCGADDARPRLRLVAADMVTCRRCGMSYVNPRVSAAGIEAKLQAWAREDVVDAERLGAAFDAGNLGHYARLERRLARHAGAGRRLLDVGCSTGAFLTVARDAGWAVQGLEIGVASSEHARSALSLEVHRASLYDFAAAPGSFDAVALLEVIEHLERPAEALARIRGLLAADGLLLLTTPNFDSLYRRLFGNRWWVVNCEDEHIVLFNRDTLASMLGEQGFEVLEVSIRGLDLQGLAREAKRALRGGDGAAPPPGAAVQGYYEARSGRARLKSALGRLGLLGAAKALLRAFDATFAWRFSPTHAWGEQLVVVARRR